MPDQASNAQPHVVLSGISKRYDDARWVVQNLDLAIHQGEFLTLLGPSGSGKTTILMMLAGFESPSSGVITIGGKPIGDMPPERRNIGMVFQHYALFPHMTVAQNVGYGLKVRGVAKADIDRRVAEVLDTVHLADLAHRKPGMLSGGQQQRTALARALVFEPSIVLMDEPLGALDKNLREHLQLEIRQIADRFQLTVVYVTHDQVEAMTLSDRIAIFDAGKVQQLSTAEDIYLRPANRFVAGFVGDNNCLPGQVVADHGARVDVRIRGDHVVQARRTDHVAPGRATTLAIRPEHVQFSRTPLAGGIAAVVADWIFCGDQVRIHVELPGGERLVVKAAAGAAALGLEKGCTAFVGLPAADAWALDA